MLDDENRYVRREAIEGLHDPFRFERRHACRWLIQQQYLGLEAQCDGNFDQALLAIRQVEHPPFRLVGNAERGEQLRSLVAYVSVRAGRPPKFSGYSVALRDAQRDVVQHAHIAKQHIDLKRTAQTALDAGLLRKIRNILPAKQHPARRCGEPPGKHVDKGCLTRAIRSDERMARACLETEINILRDRQGAETFTQALRFQRRLHGFAPTRERTFAITASDMPRTPPRANKTTITSIRPMPKYQYSGNCLARKSCAIRKISGPTNAP